MREMEKRGRVVFFFCLVLLFGRGEGALTDVVYFDVGSESVV